MEPIIVYETLFWKQWKYSEEYVPLFRIFKVKIFDNGNVVLYSRDYVTQNVEIAIERAKNNSNVFFQQSELTFDNNKKISNDCLNVLKAYLKNVNGTIIDLLISMKKIIEFDRNSRINLKSLPI